MTLPTIEREPACKKCRFYRTKTYQCKLNPPTVIVLPREDINPGNIGQKREFTLQPAATFPMLSPDDWCGQFQAGTNHENESDTAENEAAKQKAANLKPSNESNIVRLR